MRPPHIVCAALLLSACGTAAVDPPGGSSSRGGGSGASGSAGLAGGGGSSPDGAPPPTASTSFTLASSTGGAKLPFTLGLVFKKGDVPSDFGLDLRTTQVVVKRRWNDGSVKHAVVSGHVDLAPGQPKTVTVVPGTGPDGTKLACSDIRSAAPRASVTLGELGSVDLAALLASPTRTWLTGPQAVECHYRTRVGADPTLRVEFHVRLYREGRLFVRAIVENGYLDVPTASKSYAPTVTIDGEVVYDNGGQSLTNYPHTRWFAEGWIGGDPQVIPEQDIAGLVASRLVPNYKQKPAASAALDALYRTYQPYEHGGWTPNMGETGFQDQIGLLPNWDALYVTSSGDPRARASSMANAKALNSYPLVWRDSADDSVVHPSGRPSWTVEGPNAGGDTTVGAGTLVWDNAHHGSGGYLAYLLTGDYLFLETMEMQASLAYLMISSSQGLGPARILTGQTRAMGWANRTVGQYAAVAPPGPITDDYRALLAANAAHWRGVAAGLAGKKLGLVYSYELADTGYGPGLLAPWQVNFVTQVFGYVSDLEPLADMTDWNAVRDYAYQFPVGLLGAGGSDGYCFTQASQYTLKVADDATSVLGTTYASWGAVYAKTFGAAPCGNTLLGSSGGAPEAAATGYYGNLMPAIAYAVDHGAPGAAEAWARFTAAANFSLVQSSGFDSVACWGVVPR